MLHDTDMSGGAAKLPHSHSTPAGVDGGGGGGSRTPPATPKKGGKMLAVRVQMLDDTMTMFQVQAKALGRVLFDQVCKQLHLLEADYFGLEYQEPNGTRYWLDLEKPLSRQVGLSLVDTLLRFCVKFYTPDPAQLEEEFTRYLYCLQIKRDLAQGLLQCNDNTAALMASYIVQAECGDYVVEDYPDHTYLSTYKFVPNQDTELERRIMENHKKHAGQSPAEADLNLLETSRRCELYGMKMHPAKDHEGVPLNLAVAHMGIVVFQNFTKINTFSWAKIRKISFKRKRFLVKLHPEGYSEGYYKDTVEFFFEGRNECKNFWKKCVENHGFFRCSTVKHVPRQKTRVLSRGSSFRYSGRTQKQIVEFVRENYVKRQTFQRSQSFRHSSSAHSSVVNVGTSLSAHPLLPLGDNAVAGTAASLSCGSMTLTAAEHLQAPRRRRRRTSRGEDEGAAVDGEEEEEVEEELEEEEEEEGYAMATAPILAAPSTTPTPTIIMSSSSSHTVDIHELATSTTTMSLMSTMTTTAAAAASFCPPGEETSSPRRFYSRRLSSSNHHQQQPAGADAAAAAQQQPPPGHPHNADDVTPSYVNNGELSSVCSPGSDVTISPSKVGNAGVEGEVEVRKKRFPMDRAYFIAKEMLMTERTYKKDLEVITVWYREEVCGQYPGPVQAQLLSLVDPLHAGHSLLLRELEGRLVTWEGRGNYRGAADYLRLGDVLLRHMDILPLYERYLEEHLVVLQQLEEVVQKETALAQLHHDFQLHKVCYLPLTALLLKPLHRLLHHEALLHRLLHHYGDHHPDLEDCRAARDRLACTTCSLPAVLRRSENYAQLCELQREVRGWDHLVQGSRQFLRQGCLMKLCRKGYQQRMFLLFSDVLVYASRSSTPPVRFHVHGHLAVHQLQVDGCPQHQGLGAAHGFTIRAPGRTMVVAAASRHDRDGWMEDLAGAIVRAGTSTTSLHHLGLRSCSSSEEGVDVPDACTSAVVPRDRDTDTREKAVQAPRSNTTVHVCWHRNTSISMADQLRAAENQLSGYLLRKFKNTSGWQKLWVVCTTFCLYFYKSHHDAAPLASLPLLGYEARTPAPADGIAKDYVVKLVYRNHVYYFRAESHYTFCRWMEVISCATQHCGRATPCSLQDS